MENKIKAIIFDFGNIFVSYDPWEKYKYLESITGIKKEELRKIVGKIADPLVKGIIGVEEFWKRLSEKISKDLPGKGYDWWLIGAKFRIHWDIVRLARKLKEKGYKVALLTNTIEPHYNLHVKEGHYTLVDFDTIVASNKVKMKKPEKAIYIYTLEKLGVKPQEAVFIDDLEENIRAAREVGIHVIQFDATKDDVRVLVDELKKLGIEI